LRNTVGLMRVGDKVDLTLLREGKPRTVTVTIGKDTSRPRPARSCIPGWRAQLRTRRRKQYPRSGHAGHRGAEGRSALAAARSGLRPGDVITA